MLARTRHWTRLIRSTKAWATIGAAAALWLAPGAIAQIDAGRMPELNQPPKPVLPVIPTQILGLNIGPMQEVALGVVDEAMLRAEDDGCGGKCMRVGIVRPLQGGLTPERWLQLPNGQLWVGEVSSPGATAMRVHLVNIDLPVGAQLVAYNPMTPQWAVGPVEGTGPVGDGTFWMNAIEGDHVRIECFIPNNANGKPAPRLPFSIADVSHDYRNPLDPADMGANGANHENGEDGGLAGTPAGCHNDINCFPAWNLERDAVAHIRFVSGGGTFICSGTLMNDVPGELPPLFLTANHCISTNAVANTCTFYWDYQQATPCVGDEATGATPALGSVPQSAVATLLSTAAASDYCLLRVDGALPCGRGWVGSDPNPIPNGLASAGIHHPAGLPKKISFGTKDSTLACGGGSHVRSNWTNGITLGGSSGSGIFRVDDHRLYGQLHCGDSACGNVTWDQYGAWVNTWPLVSGFFASNGLGDDSMEPNDTCATAYSLADGSYLGRVLRYAHDDWYRVNIPNGGTLNFSLSFTHANGDIDVIMYPACGGSYVAGSFGTSNTEAFSYTNTGASQDFFVNVYRYGCDTRNEYNMTKNVILNNDECSTPIAITSDSYFPPIYSTTAANASGGEPQESCEAGFNGVNHTVWYTYTPCTNGSLNVNTIGSNYDTVLSVFSGSCGGAVQVDCDDDGGGSLTSSLPAVSLTAYTTYLIKVAAYHATLGTGGNLDFNFTFTPSGPAPTNDACLSARVIASNSYSDGPYNTTAAGSGGDPLDTCTFAANSNSVWYSFTPHANGVLDMNTFGSNFDTVLSVWTGGCGGLVSIACNDDYFGAGLLSRISGLALTDNVTYLIKVADYNLPGGGCMVLNFAFDPVSPANDDCSTATTIVGNAYTPPLLDISDAGTFFGEHADVCGFPPNAQSVWYRYTPIACGRLNLNTFGSTYDTVASVFRGDCVAAVHLDCNDDAPPTLESQISNLRLNAGFPYLIKVTNYNLPDPGNLDFNFSFTPGSCCVADIVPVPNGDGQVNVSDLLAVIAAWGGCNYCAEDIAPAGGDGLVNVTDLLAVIGGWGPCPP